jgi:hypothetical protein
VSLCSLVKQLSSLIIISSSSFEKDLGTRKQREAKGASTVCFSDKRSAARRSENIYSLEGTSHFAHFLSIPAYISR